MPKLTSQKTIETVYSEISRNPGITITALAEKLGMTRDRAKHLMTVTLDANGCPLMEVSPDPKYIKRRGMKPRGFAVF